SSLIFEGFVTQRKKHQEKYWEVECIELAWELERHLVLSGHKKRIKVKVENGGNRLVDYPIYVPIYWEEGMDENFGDLLFADDQNNVLPHWIEEYVAGSWAGVWVKCKEIPPGVLYVWCYFKTDVPTGGVGDPYEVFPVFVDCESGSPEDWFLAQGDFVPDLEFVSGQLKVSWQDAASYSLVTVKGYSGTNYALEADAKVAGDMDAGLFVRRESLTNMYGYFAMWPGLGELRAEHMSGYSTVCSGPSYAVNDWYKWSFRVCGQELQGVHESGVICSGESGDFGQGYCGFVLQPHELGAVLWVDRVRIRPYVLPEPSVTPLGSEDAQGSPFSLEATFEQKKASEIVSSVVGPLGWTVGDDFDDMTIEKFTVKDDNVLDVVTKLAREYMEKEIWFGPGRKINISSARSDDVVEVTELNVVADVEDGKTQCDGVVVRGQGNVTGVAGNPAGKCTLLHDMRIKTVEDANAFAARELALRSAPVLTIEATTKARALREAMKIDVPGHSVYKVEQVLMDAKDVRLKLVKV
ncbi:MAG: hypothetical protein DRP15_04085, partial [Candidatus Aenigmatarchaeota archaeon]